MGFLMKGSEPSESQSSSKLLEKLMGQYWKQTSPLRKGMMDQYLDLLQGKSPEKMPEYAPIYGAARTGLEDQYGVAKQNIIENTAKGGTMQGALADLNLARAKDVGSLPAQISQQLIQQLNQQMYGAGWGAPGQVTQGLTGSGNMQTAIGTTAMNNKQDSSWQGIVNGCCFIFIAAALDQVLHPVARRFRDEHMTPRNRRGYYRLADLLVPAMKRNRVVMWLVRKLMTEPMISFGRWHYGIGKVGILFAPLTATWLTVFSALGFRTYRRKNGEVI